MSKYTILNFLFFITIIEINVPKKDLLATGVDTGFLAENNINRDDKKSPFSTAQKLRDYALHHNLLRKKGH